MEKPTTVIASIALNNFGGIEILELDDANETVTWRYHYHKAYEPQTTGWLFDEVTGEPYVIIDGSRYDFDQFIRTDL